MNVLPPISGSLTSAPSIANTASTPRCPLMANCWVKFVCPFTSVIVPAANSNNALKSRPFNGNSSTFWLESFSPPVPLAGFEVVLGFPSETPAAGVCGLAAIDSTF